MQHRQLPHDRSFAALFRPDDQYPYFAGSDEVPFRPTAKAWEPGNAWWLAELSLLAYTDAVFFRSRVKRAIPGATLEAIVARDPARAIDVQAYVVSARGLTIVVFRGTAPGSWLDLATDLKFIQERWMGGDGRVHAGFKQALEMAWDGGLRTTLGRLGPTRRVWFTGHGLGAALAVLAAGRWRGEKGSSAVQGLYAFGLPLIGNPDYTRRFETSGCFRLVNNNDIVTQIPPALWGVYGHVGTPYYIDSDGHLHLGHGPEGFIIDRIRGAVFEGLRSIRQWLLGDVNQLPVDAIVDHAPTHYAIHCWNACVDARQGAAPAPGAMPDSLRPASGAPL